MERERITPGERQVEAQEILRRRARELARAIVLPEDGERLEVVEFRLGEERLAFESAWVKEVFVPRAVVPVPGAPPFIAGIVNLRGTVVSVVDLRRVLSLPAAREEYETASVLLLANGEMEFGVIADRVEGARLFPRRELAPSLSTLPEGSRHFQRGVFTGAVSLLDARLLLASPQLRVDQGESTDPSRKDRA